MSPRSADEPGGPCPQEELSSTSVEHLIINPNAAYEKFKDKRLGTEGLDFSDGVSKTRRTGCRSGERDMLGGGAQESPQQLLGPSAAVDFADPEGALAKRLLQQLEVAKHSKAPPGKSPPAKSSSPPGDAVTFELYWRPEQDQFAQTAKIAELEKRLAQLEATVRCEPDSQNPLLAGLKGTNLMETMQVLQAKVNILDVAVLDQVEARLQSVLGKVNEMAKHKAMAQDTDTQSKIQQLHETLQRWDPVATALPDVVQRLVTLRDLHEQAAQFGQVLVHLDTTQQDMVAALKDNAALLAEVQKTMKENLAIVEDNFADIDARIKRLQK